MSNYRRPTLSEKTLGDRGGLHSGHTGGSHYGSNPTYSSQGLGSQYGTAGGQYDSNSRYTTSTGNDCKLHLLENQVKNNEVQNFETTFAFDFKGQWTRTS